MQNFQVNPQFTKVEPPQESGGYSKFVGMILTDFFFYSLLWVGTIIIATVFFNFLKDLGTASSTIFLVLFGWTIILLLLAFFAALAIFSLLFIIAALKGLKALTSPPGKNYFKRKLGARDPSTNENKFIYGSLQRFSRQGVKVPTRFLILDNSEFVMSIYGDVFIISSQQKEEDDFLPYCVHELGHYNCSDARLHLAVHLYNPVAISRLFRSGVWAKYFRERDFLADRFAARLGQRGQLIDALEKVKPLQEPFNEKEDEVPPAEIRIDRLRNYRP